MKRPVGLHAGTEILMQITNSKKDLLDRDLATELLEKKDDDYTASQCSS